MEKPNDIDNKDQLRNIISVINNSLDIDKTKETIIEVVCKTLNADMCFIADYDQNTNRFLPIEWEYLSTKKLTSCKGQEIQEIFPTITEVIKTEKSIIVENATLFKDDEKQDFQLEDELFDDNISSSAFAIPLFYQNNLLGIFSVSYAKERKINKFEKDLLQDVANQMAIAINQANLHKSNQIQLERANMLARIIDTSRKSLILQDVVINICKEIVNLFEISRVAIVKFPPNLNDNRFNIVEYTANENIKEIKKHPNLQDALEYWRKDLIQETTTKISDNLIDSKLPEKIVQIYKDIEVKALACIPLEDPEGIWGWLFLSQYENDRGSIRENIDFLETIAAQIFIAIRQSELYEKEKEAREREALLRTVTESIRNTLDIDELQKTIVEEIARALNADRCFIMEYNKDTDKYLPVQSEFLSSCGVKSIIGFDLSTDSPDLLELNKRNKSIIFTDLNKYLAKNNFYNTSIEEHFTKYEVKSGFSVPIFYSNELLGILAIHYTKQNVRFISEEQQLVNSLANQIGIALNQARLFKKEIAAKEREKMNSNIVEILRISLDKTMIKKMFVKNIRKYFNADIVYLVDYDSEKKEYMPFDKNSEALSNYNEKSFANYDWAKSDITEYVQPLLNKEELLIPDVDNYILENKTNKEFSNLFQSANIKSSYNLPITNYQNLMGFLSINFTDSINILSQEDLSRLKDICTQVGMALYQAQLYLKAQQCFFSKESLLESVREIIKSPIKTILYEATHLSQNEIEREAQVNNIVDNCQRITDFTREISRK